MSPGQRGAIAALALAALVFAWAGEDFEDPGTRSFLRGVDGVDLVAMDPRGCADTNAHRAVFSPLCTACARPRAGARFHGAQIVVARREVNAGPGRRAGRGYLERSWGSRWPDALPWCSDG